MGDNGKGEGRGRREEGCKKMIKGGIEIQLNLQTMDTVETGLLFVLETSLSRELCLKITYKCSQPFES